METKRESQRGSLKPSVATSLKLKIIERPIDSVRPRTKNPRTHTPAQIRQIAESLRTFGFVNPILLGGDGAVVAGHGRLEAARLLGLAYVPTIELRHLSADEIRAYAIADNRLAELSGWDKEILAIELQELSALDLEFDVSITGFATAEIDVLIEGITAENPDPLDEVVEPDLERPPVSRPGDLWQCGPHRVYCGDAREVSAYGKLLGRRKAQLVITDPPYNVPIHGHVSGLGRQRHREFAMASGEMSEADFTSFLRTVLGHLARFSNDGSIHYVFMDWRHADELRQASRGVYTELKNVCVWVKTNAGMGSLYRSQHEFVFAFKNGTAAHINNVELGRYGRYRTNVWSYPGVNTFREGRMEELASHPTPKPVALVADAILDCSRRGGVVLDAFGGSGATLVAAAKTGRRAHLIEIDPIYVDVTVQRFEKLTGEGATCAATGRSFAEIREERTKEMSKQRREGVGSSNEREEAREERQYPQEL